MNRHLFIGALLILLSSCTHAISRENLASSATTIPFREVQQHIEEYMNKQFIFGGIIAETVTTKEDSEIEVVQTPLDRWGNIIARDISDGRFMVKSKKYLDPFIFRAGREITISGVLTGRQRKAIGGSDYDYPVFEAKEIRLWPEGGYYPYPIWREPLYYPYPYYWYDPFWHRPFFYPY